MRKCAGAGGVLLLSIALPLAASAQELPPAERYHLRVEWRWWQPTLNGDVQKGFGSAKGTLLSLTDDLGVQDDNTWNVSGAIKFTKSIKFVGSFIPIHYTGRQAANTNISYGEQLFFRGEQLLTDLKGELYSGAIEWDFVRNKNGYVGGLLGAKALLFDSVVLAPDSAKRVVDTETLPVPIVGLTARAYGAKRFSVSATIAGFTIGERGKFWEVDLSGRVHFSDRLAGQVGYYRFSLEGKDARDFAKMSLGGLTFGGEVSF